jgi:hypothetical protein
MKALKFEGIEELPNELLNLAGIAWGFIYFVMGVAGSFTINAIDFWSSVALLFLIFLLPLPIAVVARWFPRVAGITLIVCAAIGIVIAVLLTGIKDIVTASPGIRLFIPNFVFAVAYIVVGQTPKTRGETRP